MVVNKKMEAVIPIYGNLIVNEQKKIIDVPGVIRDDVKAWLVNNGHGELAVEDV